MNKFLRSFVLAVSFVGFIGDIIINPSVVVASVADDIDKILKAKDIVRKMVNFPDTLVFHDLYTKVRGNTVTLKFTCKNAFGAPETHVKDIRVD